MGPCGTLPWLARPGACGRCARSRHDLAEILGGRGAGEHRPRPGGMADRHASGSGGRAGNPGGPRGRAGRDTARSLVPAWLRHPPCRQPQAGLDASGRRAGRDRMARSRLPPAGLRPAAALALRTGRRRSADRRHRGRRRSVLHGHARGHRLLPRVLPGHAPCDRTVVRRAPAGEPRRGGAERGAVLPLALARRAALQPQCHAADDPGGGGVRLSGGAALRAGHAGGAGAAHCRGGAGCLPPAAGGAALRLSRRGGPARPVPRKSMGVIL